MCVQNLDDSRGLAIRITYRISLRSSSLWEPRHPLLKVVRSFSFHTEQATSVNMMLLSRQSPFSSGPCFVRAGDWVKEPSTYVYTVQ